jgi:RNA polymerase sigma-70 factor (ECF subfamily)
MGHIVYYIIIMESPDKTTDPGTIGPRMGRTEFAEMYQALYRRLWLTAVGILGDRTEADDIVQEAAMIAFGKRDDFRPGSNFGAWVSEIVKHCAANHKRKTAGRRTFATDPLSLDQESSRPSAGGSVDTSGGPSALIAQFDDDILRVLRQLSPDARCCLLLRIVDGMSYSEIARFLGIPEGTAMSHVHRSKRQIRARLGVTHPSKEVVDE